MKTLLSFLIPVTICVELTAQNPGTHFTVETILHDTTFAVYKQNNGVLNYNSVTGDLVFAANLAEIRTGDRLTDSLLFEKKQLPLSFQGNLGQNFFGVVREENDGVYHKITGNLSVNAVTYPQEAFVGLENFTDVSNPSKVLIDFKMEVNPRTVFIPFLSNYFKKPVLFLVNDGVILK